MRRAELCRPPSASPHRFWRAFTTLVKPAEPPLLLPVGSPTASERRLLVRGQRRLQRSFDASRSENARQRKTNLARHPLGMARGGEGQDRFFVVADRADDPRKRCRDAKVGRALTHDDVVGRTPHLLVDLLFDSIGHRTPDLFSEGGKGEDAHPYAGPDYDLRIAVLTKDVRVYRVCRDSNVLPDQRANARCPDSCRTRKRDRAATRRSSP